MRTAAGVLALAEVVVFVLVANWIGLGATILLTLATSALGMLLIGRQGTRALTELRSQAAERRPSGRALGDAGLVAVGGLLMLLPGFIGDVVGLLCLLPPTRPLLRGLIGRLFVSRLPAHLRGPVRVRSARAAGVGGPTPQADRPRADRPLVIEGEVLRDDPQQ